MPTINLGRVRFNWRGQYDPKIPYQEYDCVEDDGQSYVCIAPVSGTGPNDTEGGTYWGSMLIRSADYNQARQDAINAAAASIDSATDSANSATASANSATEAAGSQEMAERWASEAEDVEVGPGKYSAKHYAAKAAAFGDPNQFIVTAHQTEDTRSMAEWAAQTLNNQQILAEVEAEQTVSEHEAKSNPHPQYARVDASNDFAVMPSVNGAPILESGSNSDGKWVKWADGTQHCYWKDTSTTTTQHSWGAGLYVSPAMTKTFPAGFTGSVEASFAGGLRTFSGGATVWGVADNTSSTSCRIVMFSTGSNGTGFAGYIVTGRWK